MIDKKLKEILNRKSSRTYAPAVQNNLRELILNTAEKKIPFQRLASSRVTEQTQMHLRIAMVVWLRH
jgi:hypothetical protein